MSFLCFVLTNLSISIFLAQFIPQPVESEGATPCSFCCNTLAWTWDLLMQYIWLPERSCEDSYTNAAMVHLRFVSEGQNLHLLAKEFVSPSVTYFFLLFFCAEVHWAFFSFWVEGKIPFPFRTGLVLCSKSSFRAPPAPVTAPPFPRGDSSIMAGCLTGRGLMTGALYWPNCHTLKIWSQSSF